MRDNYSRISDDIVSIKDAASSLESIFLSLGLGADQDEELPSAEDVKGILVNSEQPNGGDG